MLSNRRHCAGRAGITRWSIPAYPGYAGWWTALYADLIRPFGDCAMRCGTSQTRPATLRAR